MPITTSPEPIAPEDGAQLPTLTTQLRWRNPAGTTRVRIEVRPADGVGLPVDVSREDASTTYDVRAGELMTGKAYQWSIRASDTPVLPPPLTIPPSAVVWGPPSTPRTITVGVKAPPTLIAPAAGARIEGLTTQLRWANPARTTQVHLRVTDLAGMMFGGGPSLSTILSATEIFEIVAPPAPAAFLSPGLYQWSVRATDAPGPVGENDASWGPWSESRVFVAAPLAVPILQAPTNGAVLPSVSTQLVWENPVGASQVHLEVRAVLSASPLVSEVLLGSQNRYDVPARLLSPQMPFTWRVRVSHVTDHLSDGDTRWGEWSETRSFITGAGERPRLLAPESDARLPGLRAQLRWDNPTGATQVHLQIAPVSGEGPAINTILGGPTTQYDLPAESVLPATAYTWRARVSAATTAIGENDTSWGPWSDPSTFTTGTKRQRLAGHVVLDDGRPAEGLGLRLYRHAFGGSAIQLTETTTDAAGRYSLTYDPGPADQSLEVRAVKDGKEELLSRPLNNLEANAALNLAAPRGLQPVASEYERLMADLAPHLGDLEQLAAAREDQEHQDLTALNRATGWDARLIALAATGRALSGDPDITAARTALSSQHLAAAAATGTDVLPQALYGLLRAGLPSDKHLLAQVPPQVITDALAKVNERGIIKLTENDVTWVTAQLREFAGAVLLDVAIPGAPSTYRDLLAETDSVVSTADRDKFISAFVDTAGKGVELWKAAEDHGVSASAIEALKLQGEIATLTDGSAKLTGHVQKNLAQHHLSELASAGLHRADAWLKTVYTSAHITAEPRAPLSEADKATLEAMIPAAYLVAGPVEAALQAWTEDMARRVRGNFPTAVVSHLLDEPGDAFQLGPTGPVTSTLLKSALDHGFELGRTPVRRFLEEHEDVRGAVPAADFPAAQAQLSALHRVRQIAPSNEAMATLFRLGLTSAYDVVAVSERVFLEDYGASFPSVEEARAVYQKAQLVATVAQQVVTTASSLMTNLRPAGLEAVASSDASSASSHQLAAGPLAAKGVGDGVKSHYPTLEALFGSLDYCDCEHYRSVLSPAAYLVDLLQFLDRATQGGDTTGETPYDVLTKRRPDLPELALTCDNTNTTLPYIDLVNEILEHCVARGSLSAEAAHNTEGATAADLRSEPQHVMAEAYNTLRQQVYPMGLPFDQPLETVRELLSRFDAPLAELLEAFRRTDDLHNDKVSYDRYSTFIEGLGFSPAEAAIFSDPDPLNQWWALYGYESAAEAHQQGMDPETNEYPDLNSAKVLARRLDISYQELVDILQTGFVNPGLAGLRGLRRLGISLQEARMYRDASVPSASADDKTWLAGFEERLTKLSTLHHEFDARDWLQKALRERVFDGALLLADTDAGGDFDHTTLQYFNGTAADDLAFLRINLFVRLWRKLGWSIEETDTILQSCIPAQAPYDRDHFKQRPLMTALVYLAHLTELDRKLSLGRQGKLKLVTLWSDIPTVGPRSLYRLLFDDRLRRDDPVFDSPVGDFLPERSVGPSAEGLKLGARYFDTQHFGETGNERIDISTYPKGSVADNARNYLAIEDGGRAGGTGKEFALHYASMALDFGGPLVRMSMLIGHTENTPFTLTINGDTQTYTSLNALQGPQAVEIGGVQVCSAVLQLLPRSRVLLTLDGDITTFTIGGRALWLDDIRALRKADPGRGLMIADRCLAVQGALGLTAADLDRILAYRGLSAASTELSLSTVSLLYRYSMLAGALRLSVADLLTLCDLSGWDPCHRLHPDVLRALDEDHPYATLQFVALAEAMKKSGLSVEDLDYLLRHRFDPVGKYRSDRSGQPDLASLPDNVKAALAQVAPPITLEEKDSVRDFVQQTVIQQMAAQTGIVPELMRVLLLDGMIAGADGTTRPLSDLLCSFDAEEGMNVTFFERADFQGRQKSAVLLNADTREGRRLVKGTSDYRSARYEGYLRIPSPGVYQLRAELDKKENAVVFRLPQRPAPILSAVATHDVFKLKSEVYLDAGVHPFTLEFPNMAAGGQRVFVEQGGRSWDDLAGLAWRTPPSGALVRVAPDLSVSSRLETGLAERCLCYLSKVNQLVGALRLTTREVRHILLHPESLGRLDFASLPTEPASHGAGSAPPLAGFLRLAHYASLKQELSSGTDDLIDVLEADSGDAAHRRLAQITHQDPEDVVNLCLSLLGPSGVLNDASLLRVARALRIIGHLRVPVASAFDSTDIVKPGHSGERGDQIAQALKAALKARLDEAAWRGMAQGIFDQLRRRQRNALVASLVHTRGLASREELYDELLVDPGMEPAVQTSRVRLAISSVQLFVQRILLNLEPAIPPDSLVNPSRWEWLKHYRVWEANRKIFLFPENWLEPEFRDDKTPLFAELEGELLQGDVSPDLAEDAFLNYLRKLDEISRLEIIALHREVPPSGAPPILHVIGRTFTQPHKYFYRRFESDQWSPWEPVSASIEGDHLAPVVWRDRFYLFWVTFQEKPPEGRPTSSPKLGDAIPIPEQRHKAEINLHWSEYIRGQWGPVQSAAAPGSAPMVKEGPGAFDSSQVPITVSKDADRGLYIRLGAPVMQYFYLAGPGSTIQTGSWEGQSDSDWRVYDDPARPSLYTGTGFHATLWTGSGALTAEFPRDTGRDPDQWPKRETPTLLGVGGAYSLQFCNELDTQGTPPATSGINTVGKRWIKNRRDEMARAQLKRPFFYQDRAYTFLVVPELKRVLGGLLVGDVIQSPDVVWSWRGNSPFGQGFIPAVEPVVQFRMPSGPELPAIPPDSISTQSIASVLDPSDWVTHPSSLVLYDKRAIGPRGGQGLELALSGLATVEVQSGDRFLPVLAGSPDTAGNGIVIRGGATNPASVAWGEHSVSVVGPAGLNPMLQQNLAAKLGKLKGS